MAMNDPDIEVIYFPVIFKVMWDDFAIRIWGVFLQFSGLFMKYAFLYLLSLLPYGSNSCYEQLESSEKETILFKLNINGFNS